MFTHFPIESLISRLYTTPIPYFQFTRSPVDGGAIYGTPCILGGIGQHSVEMYGVLCRADKSRRIANRDPNVVNEPLQFQFACVR